MNKTIIWILIAGIFLFRGNLSAQSNEQELQFGKSFSLEEIQEQAVAHNYEARNARLDMEIARKQKWETTAIGLPNINASVEYQNFPDIPTQMFPNFIAPAVVGVNQQVFGLTPIAPLPEGEQMPVQFGAKHNTSYGFSVSQLVFSGEYIVALKASQIYLELSKTAHQRKTEEVKETVTKTYYLILISEETIKSLDSIYSGLQSLKNETQHLADVGFIEQTDVKQIELNLKNTENSINNMRQQLELLYRMLKFQSGLAYDVSISLSTDLLQIINEIESGELINQEFDIYADTDFKMLQVQESLSNLELQREKSKVLPELTAFFSYSENAQQEELDWFGEDAQWFPTTVWGLNLSIPIFSSGGRWARIQQKQMKLEQLSNTKEQTKQVLMIDYIQTRTNYISKYNNLKNSENAKELSKTIYENTLIKYKTGTASGLELTQAQNQYFSAIGEYYGTLSDISETHIKLKRILKSL